MSSASSNGRERHYKWLLFACPVLFVCGFLVLKFSFPAIYWSIVQEDDALECQQALCYFLSSVVSCSLAIRFLRNQQRIHGLLFLGLAVALLFVSLEEISWGQRFFHIPTPTFFQKYNTQHEISLHNLPVIQYRLSKMYVLAGTACAFGWLLIPRLFPLQRRTAIRYFLPDWFLTLFFVPVLLFYLYFMLSPILVARWGCEVCRIGANNTPIILRDQEPTESLFTLGFFLYLLHNKIRQNREQMANQLDGPAQ